MSDSGGSAALRGYRLQTLYILSRLMNAESHEHSFRPEGKEDLDILHFKWSTLGDCAGKGFYAKSDSF